MDRRIFGLETEYGVTCAVDQGRGLSADEVARYLFRKVVAWGRSSNVFLRNGSRLYLDVGSHPEYATAECDDIPQLIAHDRGGERILEGLVADAQQRLVDEGVPGTIHLFKNNTDSAGNSYGCHENYSTSRANDMAHYAEVLIPFFVSRQIFTGAGKVLQTARGATFSMAQRAEHIWEGVSSATTRSRPIINTRDEPHADAEKYRRLHVIVGDSNMSEYTTFVKVGSAACMLRMLEDPTVVLRDMTLENPIRAIRDISHDISCRRKVRLANSREVSALDIQREYLDRALRYADTKGFPPMEQKALEMWEHCISTIENDPLKLDREVDCHQAQPHRSLPHPPRSATGPRPRAAAGPAISRHLTRAQPVLQAAGPWNDRADVPRLRHRDCHRGSAADHSRAAPWRVHQARQGTQA